MRGFVVVSGLPASGKSTVVAILANKLHLPLFDKDTFLEALFESHGTGSSVWRRELSKRADAQFQEAAAAQPTAVMASWWKHPLSTLDSGTPIEWLCVPGRVAVEVHCVCSASVAAARFLARGRHPGHLDERWSHGSLLAMLMQQNDLGPLFPARSITLHTEEPVAVQDLVRAVRAKAKLAGSG